MERLANRDQQDAILEELFSHYTVAELTQLIMKAGVPCGPINKVDQIAADPQVQHLGIISEVPHSQIPDLKLPGIPIQLSRTPGAIQSPPPLLGEHTNQILSEIGYTEEQISGFRADGVVA